MITNNKVAKVDARGWYGNKLKGWPKAAGPAPTAADFDKAHAAGLRPGSEVAFANALMYRATGMTAAELAATGTRPQFNAMRGMVAAGLVKLVPTPPRDGSTVYRLALTPKGEKAAVTRAKAKAPKAEADAPVAKPAKAKATKPRTAKAPKVDAPAADTPAADTPAAT